MMETKTYEIKRTDNPVADFQQFQKMILKLQIDVLEAVEECGPEFPMTIEFKIGYPDVD